MRTSKRTLAGVAAGALGLALIPFVAVSSSQAATTIAGTPSPVRYSAASGVDANVPAAGISWKKASANALAVTNTPRLFFDGTTSAGGKMYLYNNLITPTYGTEGTPVGISALDDTIIVGDASGNTLGANADDSVVYFKVDKAGRYTGKIANGVDTVTFDFTTAGAPTAVTLTPATQEVLVGGSASMTLGLTDLNGNPTQPSTSSAVAFTQTGAGGDLSTSSVSAAGQANLDDTTFALGSVALKNNAMKAGSTTVTGTGSGDLLGQSASATISTSGTISDDSVVNMAVTAPATGVWNKPGQDDEWEAQVRTGTSSLTVTIDDTTANTTGAPIRLKVSTTLGSVTAGSSTATLDNPIYVDVTPTAGKASATLALGGAAALAPAVITIQQVLVDNANIDGVTNITITQVVPVVYESGITVTPNGNVTRALGATTNVTVSVDDSLGDPVPNTLVGAYRDASSSTIVNGNLISSAVTGSDGSASVAVTNASTLTTTGTETYRFAVAAYNASASNTDYLPGDSRQLVVNYSATGAVTSVTVTPRSADPFDSPSTLTTSNISWITTPSTTGKLGTTASTGTYVESSKDTGGAPTPWVDFRVATVPSNSFTVTVPEGVKVSTTAPTSTSIWSDGTTSVEASADDSVYMWATKTGIHEYTVTSGGISASGKVIATNTARDAYNIAVSPAEQQIPTGGFATATVSVTDVFGNPVASTADDTGGVTVTASGEILLGGFLSSQKVNTNASGVATVTVIGSNTAGQGVLTAVPTNATATGNNAPAFRPVFTPPTGAPAPVLSAVAEVGVGEVPGGASIVLTGERDNRSIVVSGATTGLAEGTVVRPWIKFPGQTSYTQGVASRTVSITDQQEQTGEFTWQRRTGKKTYVYFRVEGGTVQSLRIIIPAR